MRRRKLALRNEEDAHVDMTPMLDIIFIMLIFFIVTTSFVKESGFLINKSEASKSTNNKSANIGIHIDENDIIYLNNKPVDIERLPARIEYFLANTPTDNILLRPHKDTSYQKVVSVLDQIGNFKHLKISIGTYEP
jgi:biopolymer transport protein ExbD